MRDCDIDNGTVIVFSERGNDKDSEPIAFCYRCGEPIYFEDELWTDENENKFCNYCFNDLLYEGEWKGEEQKWLTVEK